MNNFALELKRGFTTTFVATYRQPQTVPPTVDALGNVVTPDPVNITGASAKMQIRSKLGDTTALLTLTSPAGGIALGGAAGTVAVTISAAQTLGLAVGVAGFDLMLTLADGSKIPLIPSSPVLISDAYTQ